MPVFLLTLFTLIILPQTKLEMESIPFVVCGSLAVAFATTSRVHQTSTKSGAAILAFLFVCLFHVGFVFTESVTVAEYLRGLVPFLFLSFYFVTVRLGTVYNFDKLYFGIIGVALLYALQNLVLLPQVLSGEIWRSTYVNSNHNIPLPLVGFHFCVALALSRKLRFGVRTALIFIAAMMLLSSFLTGTRSLIISTLFPLTILPFTEAGSLKKWARYGVALALLATTFLFVPIEPILRGARIGGSQEGSIDTRLQENEVALGFISDSPLIGNGLGFRFATTGLYYQATKVGYVHNSLLYLLMDFGLFGLLYFIAPLCAVLSLRQVRAGPHREHATGLLLALLALSMDSLGFAMVRLIHFNLIFAVLIGMLEVLKRDYAFAWRANRYRVLPVVTSGYRPTYARGTVRLSRGCPTA